MPVLGCKSELQAFTKAVGKKLLLMSRVIMSFIFALLIKRCYRRGEK